MFGNHGKWRSSFNDKLNKWKTGMAIPQFKVHAKIP
jgi:hypothetical protein